MALAENLTDATCTPFLGSGASAPHIPTGGGLAAEWARRCKYPFADGGNLARVMQYAQIMEHSGDPYSIKRALISEHFGKAEPDFTKPHQVHKVLADCSLPLYVTTNYDDFMFRALAETGSRQPQLSISPWYVDPGERPPPSPFDRRGYKPTAQEPLVFHLHGHQSAPRSLVLTEDDNIDYLVREAEDSRSKPDLRRVLPDYVRGRLRETSLLFVGYSIQDWTFHVLFRRLLYGAARTRNHVSVQFDPRHPASLDAREYVERYLAQLNIWIFWENHEDFMMRLDKRLRQVKRKRGIAGP